MTLKKLGSEEVVLETPKLQIGLSTGELFTTKKSTGKGIDKREISKVPGKTVK